MMTGKQTRIWRSNWLKGRFSANLGNVFELSQNGYLSWIDLHNLVLTWISVISLLKVLDFFTEAGIPIANIKQIL
jgi:uncharacterized iron-regulated membrane protein